MVFSSLTLSHLKVASKINVKPGPFRGPYTINQLSLSSLGGSAPYNPRYIKVSLLAAGVVGGYLSRGLSPVAPRIT